MTFCLFLFYILFPNNLVKNIVFPGKQGIYLENGIRPPEGLERLGGGGVLEKIPSLEDIWIFFGITQYD